MITLSTLCATAALQVSGCVKNVAVVWYGVAVNNEHVSVYQVSVDDLYLGGLLPVQNLYLGGLLPVQNLLGGMIDACGCLMNAGMLPYASAWRTRVVDVGLRLPPASERD